VLSEKRSGTLQVVRLTVTREKFMSAANRILQKLENEFQLGLFPRGHVIAENIIESEYAQIISLLREALIDYSNPRFTDRHGFADRARIALKSLEA
jgi:hypothetical protein